MTGDEDRLLQIASNLIENALRETPAGGTVSVTAAPGLLAVADTGPGIAAADLPHAFERFYLYDKVGKDRPVGSGLGLAIVQQLARAMGGDVSVESGAGGTTFAVRLRPQLRGVHDLEVGAVQRAEARAAGRSTTWGSARPRRTRSSRCRPRSSRSVFIACATMRACRGSFEMSTLAFRRTRRPIGGSDGSVELDAWCRAG